MSPADRLNYIIEESERMLQWAYDQAQMAFDVHGDSRRLAREIDDAEQAHRLNLAVAHVEFELEAGTPQEPPVPMFRAPVKLTGFDGDNGSRSNA